VPGWLTRYHPAIQYTRCSFGPTGSVSCHMSVSCCRDHEYAGHGLVDQAPAYAPDAVGCTLCHLNTGMSTRSSDGGPQICGGWLPNRSRPRRSREACVRSSRPRAAPIIHDTSAHTTRSGAADKFSVASTLSLLTRVTGPLKALDSSGSPTAGASATRADPIHDCSQFKK